LNLRELEDDRYESRNMLFGFKGALVTRFKAVERNIDEIFVE
jgi:hypothetical protein